MVSKRIHVLRDPTRGGVATSLNEIALQSGVGIELSERDIPVSESVLAASEMLGIDPLYVANEGLLIAIIHAEDSSRLLDVMKEHRYGINSSIIGRVLHEPQRVYMVTQIGGRRIVDMLEGEQLPRIC